MRERLLSAIPLIILFALCFVLPGWYGRAYFGIFAAVAIVLGNRELFSMMNLQDGKCFEICADVFALAGIPLLIVYRKCAQFGVDALLQQALAALFILSVFCILFARGISKEKLTSAFISIGLFFYFSWTLTFLLRIYLASPLLLLELIIMTKMGDVGAYAIGTWTNKLMHGNHKLAPVISPKKSWEGLAGGILFSVASGLVMFHCFPNMFMVNDGYMLLESWEVVIWGVLAGVVGLLGDLAESAIKRAADVKDSGKLPGIGGVLDTLDSLILVGPLFYLYLMLFG